MIVQVDVVNGYVFESMIEIEKNGLLDVQMTNQNLDEIRTFICDVCKKSFHIKKKITQHINQSHSSHLTTQISTGKQVAKNTFIDNSTSNEANKKINGCVETDNSNQITAKKNNEAINERRLFQCDFCQTSYNTKKQITLHIMKSYPTHLNCLVNPSLQYMNVCTLEKSSTNVLCA